MQEKTNFDEDVYVSQLRHMIDKLLKEGHGLYKVSRVIQNGEQMASIVPFDSVFRPYCSSRMEFC